MTGRVEDNFGSGRSMLWNVLKMIIFIQKYEYSNTCCTGLLSSAGLWSEEVQNTTSLSRPPLPKLNSVEHLIEPTSCETSNCYSFLYQEVQLQHSYGSAITSLPFILWTTGISKMTLKICWTGFTFYTWCCNAWRVLVKGKKEAT